MTKNTNTCPACHKAVSWEGNAYRPFCSDRCRLVDLQGWFGERYRISEAEDSDPEDTENTDNIVEQNGDSFSN